MSLGAENCRILSIVAGSICSLSRGNICRLVVYTCTTWVGLFSNMNGGSAARQLREAIILANISQALSGSEGFVGGC